MFSQISFNLPMKRTKKKIVRKAFNIKALMFSVRFFFAFTWIKSMMKYHWKRENEKERVRNIKRKREKSQTMKLQVFYVIYFLEADSHLKKNTLKSSIAPITQILNDDEILWMAHESSCISKRKLRARMR